MKKAEFEQVVVDALGRLVGVGPDHVKDSIGLNPADQRTVEFLVDLAVGQIAAEIGVPYPPRSASGHGGRGSDFTIRYRNLMRFPSHMTAICQSLQDVLGDRGLTVNTSWMGVEVIWNDSGKRAAEINISPNPYEILLTFWYKDAEGLED